MRHILFICTQNRLRSPTAERIFSSYENLHCLSAGLGQDAVNPVTPELIVWADIIFVMEKAHRNKLNKRFKQWLLNKPVICLNIPDEYNFMDEQLINLLKLKVSSFLPFI